MGTADQRRRYHAEAGHPVPESTRCRSGGCSSRTVPHRTAAGVSRDPRSARCLAGGTSHTTRTRRHDSHRHGRSVGDSGANTSRAPVDSVRDIASHQVSGICLGPHPVAPLHRIRVSALVSPTGRVDVSYDDVAQTRTGNLGSATSRRVGARRRHRIVRSTAAPLRAIDSSCSTWVASPSRRTSRRF